MIKEHPILFSTEMVNAILEGRKTMTRRVVKPQPLLREDGTIKMEDFRCQYILLPNDEPEITKCSYGAIGNLLYVRESYYAYGVWVKDGLTKGGKQKWKFKETGNYVEYEGGPISKSVTYISRDKGKPEEGHWYKRLARFMPKKHSRIYLGITGIKVERLNAISQEDGEKEGILFDYSEGKQFKNYMTGEFELGDSRDSFKSLWQKINGIESLELNPWVWCLRYKVLSTTGKPS